MISRGRKGLVSDLVADFRKVTVRLHICAEMIHADFPF